MSIEVILKAAEYIERREREAEHGYAMVRPYFADGVSSRRRTSSTSARRTQQPTSLGVRSLHNELEKSRRAQLRYCLERLKLIVPVGQNTNRHTTLGLLKDAKLLIQRLEHTQLDQRELLQQLRAEQHELQQHLDQLTSGECELTSGQYELSTTNAESGYQYRVHSSLSESSSGSMSSSTGYASSEHEEIDVIGNSSRDASTDSDADDALLSANNAFTMSLRLSRPL